MSDPKDRFRRLREIIDAAATSGPWEWLTDEYVRVVERRGEIHDLVYDFDAGSAANARFIATFDPETARELLGLAENIAEVLRGSPILEDEEWIYRLDALLGRIGGDQ